MKAGIGVARAWFQYSSKLAETSDTNGPMPITSRSPKRARSPLPKYSSAMLRPPMIVTWLSTVKDLLCIRRLTRRKLQTASQKRAVRLAKGLNTRISRLWCASRAASPPSRPDMNMSSTSTRTRTPRSAAWSSASRKSSPASSGLIR